MEGTGSLIALLSALQLLGPIDSGLPQVLIIGAQKSGTKALQRILSQHPQVVDRPGEIHFFDLHFEEGVDWYRAQFPEIASSKVLRIDKSPYYLFHPLVPERAHALIPNAKLIVLLRNPIDRAYSQYQMNVRNQREKLSFAEAIQIEPERLADQSNQRLHSYLSRGLYVEQLKRWLEYYPREQMLVIHFKDFRLDRKRVVSELLAFLGLPEHDDFNFEVGEIHSYPPMDPELRKELSDYFRPYNEQLELLLGRKFGWE